MSVFRLELKSVLVHLLGCFCRDFVRTPRVFNLFYLLGRFKFDEKDYRVDLVSV